MDYSIHTNWSNPGKYQARLGELPANPKSLADSFENFLIHHAAARFLGFGVPEYAETDRNLRTTERMISAICERDGSPLSNHRELPSYFYGTCHDFALLAVSKFRSMGHPARLRVGFVNYLQPGFWEDHWLCEYKCQTQWKLLDAQMGARARAGYDIDFEIDQVSANNFKPAYSMWQSIRNGDIDPNSCGVSFAGIKGDWFSATSLLRDAAVLNKIECLPWDFWGVAREIALKQAITDEIYEQLDKIAKATYETVSDTGDAVGIFRQIPELIPGETVLSSVNGVLKEQSIS